MKKISIFSITALIFCFSPVDFAVAVPITFFGQDNSYHGQANASIAENNFLTSLISGHVTETFDSFLVGTPAPLSLVFNATLTGFGSIQDNNTVLIGRWPTSGANYWDTYADFSIDFNDPIYAFGFYATDAMNRLKLELTYSNGDFLELDVGNSPAVNGNSLYFGFYENDIMRGISSIVFKGPSDKDYIGFDDMTVGFNTPVPEPATILLFGAGLACLAGIRARKK